MSQVALQTELSQVLPLAVEAKPGAVEQERDKFLHALPVELPKQRQAPKSGLGCGLGTG